MKHLLSLIIILFGLNAGPAIADCNGQFGPAEVCGSVAGGIPGPIGIGSLGGIFRRILPTSAYYIDDINGTDGAGCGQSSRSGACKTFNGFVSAVSPYDLFLRAVVVNVAAPASSYAGMACLQPWVGGGTVTLVGNTTTPTSVAVAGGSSPAFDIENGCSVILEGFSTSSTANQSVQAIKGGQIVMSAMDLGPAASGLPVVYSSRIGAYLEINDSIGPTTIHTGTVAEYLLEGSHTGELRINCSSGCLKLTANVTYTQYTILADTGSVIGTPSASFNLNSFAVTSSQFKSISNGNVQWNGNQPPLDTDIPGTSCSGLTLMGSVVGGPSYWLSGGQGCSSGFSAITTGLSGFFIQNHNNTTNLFGLTDAGVPSFSSAPSWLTALGAAPSASPTFTGTLNINAISGAGVASKYVCVDSSGNMLVQSGAC